MGDFQSTKQYVIKVEGSSSRPFVRDDQVDDSDPDRIVLPIAPRDPGRSQDPSKYTVTHNGIPLEVVKVSPTVVIARRI